jgi:hypothetical protein
LMLNQSRSPYDTMMIARKIKWPGERRMDQRPDGGEVYLRPMHSDVRK